MAAWDAESGHVDVAVQNAVAVVTLRRPDKLNALTADACRELAAILRHFGRGELVRGIVLTGTGRAFSAGLDLREAAELPPGVLVSHIELFHDITRAALGTRVPVVAALNGIAVGGACEMTLCFDARIGTPAAEYFLPENDIGLTISNAASVLLPRLVGHRAMRLVMESARISARDGLAIGMLDQIVGEADLVPAAIGIVHRWTPPGGATAAHLALLRPPLDAIEQAMAAETEATRATEADDLSRAGINRFLTRPRPAELDEADPQGELDQVGAARGSGLGPDAVQAVTDGAGGQVQPRGDLGVGAALGDQDDQLALPGTERAQVRLPGQRRGIRPGEQDGQLDGGGQGQVLAALFGGPDAVGSQRLPGREQRSSVTQMSSAAARSPTSTRMSATLWLHCLASLPGMARWSMRLACRAQSRACLSSPVYWAAMERVSRALAWPAG